jgi:hypothetical protein
LEVISPKGKRENPPKHPNPPFKKKEKEKVLGLVTNGRKRRRFLAWWAMEGEGKGSWLGGQWKEEEKVLFYLFHFSPKQLYLNLHFLSFTLRFYFALVLSHYLCPPFVFLGL